LNGRVRIGFPDTVLRELVADHLASTVMVLAISFLVLFSIIALFSRYDLILPIRRLCDAAGEIASGRFDVNVPGQPTKELAMLGESLGDMAKSLRERDEQLKRNYRALEETNLELKTSYEHQEAISSELGHSREMYRSLLDDSSDAILVCNDEDNLVLVNKAAEQFFGLSRQAMEGRNYLSFLERIKCNQSELVFDRYLKVVPEQPSESDLRFWRAADRRTLFGRATTTAIVGKDGKRLIQVIVHDATKEEEVRQNLEKTANEMERLNQMKNSFLGLASHELKTPLTIILGYVELLLSEDRDLSLDPEALEQVQHISRASERLSEIVRDMVDVSLLDGKTVELTSQEVDINVLVERAVEKALPYVEQRGQILNLNLGKKLKPVRCDVDRLLQAVGNILGNAVKFTPDRGSITVQTRTVERSRTPEKFSSNISDGYCSLSDRIVTYVEIAISDTGIGIEKEEQEAIFDKFHEVGEIEAHFTGKVAFKGRGAGLGLSIVKGIVDLHGGAVWVESPGYDPETLPGSTFYVLLPAVEADSPDVPSDES
ncbi:MAG: ATP-binding protein, partial [Desulfuromonadales bacterium]|nr:ATP-binding protein [Desulfuromonadales bacterium]